MNINVTNHAVKRYRERLFDYTSSDESIVALLKKIAVKGTPIRFRPVSCGNCTEVEYRNITVVVVHQDKHVTVLTCLGETAYRKWIKNQDGYKKIGGRVRHKIPG